MTGLRIVAAAVLLSLLVAGPVTARKTAPASVAETFAYGATVTVTVGEADKQSYAEAYCTTYDLGLDYQAWSSSGTSHTNKSKGTRTSAGIVWMWHPTYATPPAGDSHCEMYVYDGRFYPNALIVEVEWEMTP